MTAAIHISGQRFHSHIGSNEIRDIRQSTDREHIGNAATRLWDRITDWFCGTHKVEAKKLIFDMCTHKTTETRKEAAFVKLQELVSPGFQRNFVEREDQLHRSLAIYDGQTKLYEMRQDVNYVSLSCSNLGNGAIENTSDHEESTLDSMIRAAVKELAVRGRNLATEQFQKDFERRAELTYQLDDSPVTDIGSYFEAAISDEQRTVVFALCNQSIFPVVTGPIACATDLKELNYKVYPNADGKGNMEVEIYYEHDLAFEFERERFTDQTMGDPEERFHILLEQTKAMPEVQKKFIGCEVHFTVSASGEFMEAGATCRSKAV
ncbi:hypothetical protein [Polycladidibacter hongkongensis]|uniref:hypothetical protein n=1 Tax=Polycladidibacter hongkongensis TaxID=1647556 RepID=UPI0008371A9F|nr:hypothetical protein [Pseudovibrio hongkongensis]